MFHPALCGVWHIFFAQHFWLIENQQENSTHTLAITEKMHFILTRARVCVHKNLFSHHICTCANWCCSISRMHSHSYVPVLCAVHRA